MIAESFDRETLQRSLVPVGLENISYLTEELSPENYSESEFSHCTQVRCDLLETGVAIFLPLTNVSSGSQNYFNLLNPCVPVT